MDHDHVLPPQAPAADDHEVDDSGITMSPRRRKSSVAFAGGQDDEDHQEQLQAGDDDKNESLQKVTRKMMHRDVERQRRQDTKALYASLRSLLPIEYLKGKRSISDQVHQAAIYICHKEAKIRELTRKRDELILTAKNPSSPSSLKSRTSNLETRDNCAITVEPCLVGGEVIAMEIGLVTKRSSIITNDQKGGGVSVVFGALIRQGLDIVSYISTRVGDKMIHSINAKVCDGRSIDAAQLQHNLTASLSLNHEASKSKPIWAT
ncbi:unnamed protein product [Linum trigynum]|uniref:BHLH domain-containing protein n=1 Tax=Linum trigynum TaxID=586398 RepID=A0AAV2DPK1_9ROSI